MSQVNHILVPVEMHENAVVEIGPHHHRWVARRRHHIEEQEARMPFLRQVQCIVKCSLRVFRKIERDKNRANIHVGILNSSLA